jgi:signal peptidase I
MIAGGNGKMFMKKIALLCALLIALSGCEVGRRFYLSTSGQIVRVPTQGMMPTIKPGDYAVIDRRYYSTNPVKRFDMVLIKDPSGAKESDGRNSMFIKRVVGLGGETIEIRGGSLLLNGSEINEPFQTVPFNRAEKFDPFVVPNGQFFLLGDNRQNSADSRYWEKHSLEKSYIVAKVTEIIAH